jgi:hypothetical protein
MGRGGCLGDGRTWSLGHWLLEGLRVWLVRIGLLDHRVGLGKRLRVIRLGRVRGVPHWGESLGLWVVHGIVIPVVLGRNWGALCEGVDGRGIGLVVR